MKLKMKVKYEFPIKLLKLYICIFSPKAIRHFFHSLNWLSLILNYICLFDMYNYIILLQLNFKYVLHNIHNTLFFIDVTLILMYVYRFKR